jgi:hypothetical protein
MIGQQYPGINGERVDLSRGLNTIAQRAANVFIA